MTITYVAKSRRCDKPMRRSKEQCWLSYKKKHWQCTGECKNCICCIERDAYGNERHINL